MQLGPGITSLACARLIVPFSPFIRTVGHSEEHHKRFEEATVDAESHFLFISRLDAYIIKTPADFKFCEVPDSAELGDEFADEGEGTFVLDSYSVQRANKDQREFDHKTKVITNENIKDLQDISQLCTKQVGTGEMIK